MKVVLNIPEKMAVLEKIALDYFTSLDERVLIYIISIIIGGVIAILSDRSEARLGRWPFFIRGAFVIALLAAVQPIGRALMMGGFLWVLMIAELMTCAAAGYALGVVAMARCRDGFGARHRALALLAVASIVVSRLAFFVLLLRGSKKLDETIPA